jgi:hypothetical protein
LVALRLSLPARLALQPLDALLARLTPRERSSTRPARSRGYGLPVLQRDLLLAERGIARLPWVSNTCLYRAMARYALLRRVGADAAFVMGLPAEEVDANGHAWVELEGVPFEEPADITQFRVTFRYPPAASSGKTEPP